MNDFRFVSDKYDNNNTSQYRLSIQVNRDGFSVLICDYDGQILKLMHYQSGSLSASVEILKNEESLFPVKMLPFDRNILLVNTEEFTIVPNELYEPAYKELLFEYSHRKKASDLIIADRIENPDAWILFKLSEEFQSFVNQFKNSPGLKHVISTLAPYFQRKNNGSRSMYLHIAGDVLHILYFDHDRTEFLNSFRVNNIDDIVYYAVNVSKKLNLDLKEKVYLSGIIEPADQDFSFLNRYLANIELIPNEFPFEIAGQHHENYFLNLLEASA